MHTVAKREFLATFDELILRPRDLDYRVQFPGPAGANAVEAALKIARKVSGRRDVICFTNAFHGTTLGALAMTGNPLHRGGAGTTLPHTIRLPFDDPNAGAPDFTLFDELFEHSTNGDRPAAVIVESIQGEGGVNVARIEWLRELTARCEEEQIPLILDDVQMGCGRTGPFFSFEIAEIKPDVVCLSKSISGYGLPMALTLIREDLDIWEPGEHNGTFRGINPAFVTSTAALRGYWQDDILERETAAKGKRIEEALRALVDSVGAGKVEQRGRGLIHGLAFTDGELAGDVISAAFDRGLLVEGAGPADEVVKLMPPLTITDDELDQGLALLAEAIDASC
jgi:diaminobutyrate-2-oxoglutarate transaminase